MPEMQSPRLPLGIIEKHVAYGSLTSGCAVEKPEPKAYNEGRVQPSEFLIGLRHADRL